MPIIGPYRAEHVLGLIWNLGYVQYVLLGSWVANPRSPLPRITKHDFMFPGNDYVLSLHALFGMAPFFGRTRTR